MVFAEFNKHIKLFEFFRMTRITGIMNQLNSLVAFYRLQNAKLGLALYNCLVVFKTVFWMTFVIHLLSCLWIRIGFLEQWHKNTWVDEFGLHDEDQMVIYVNSFYYITATFSTIGYGDIYAWNQIEKSSMIFLIVISLILYSLIQQMIHNILYQETVTHNILKIRGQFDDLYAGIGGLTNLVTKHSGEKADFRELDETSAKPCSSSRCNGATPPTSM